jgi:hypothetical protein
MSIVEVKDSIVNLLGNIVKRSEIIEKQSGTRNLLEIDLAMEDIRLLYREMDRLRKFTEVGNTVDPFHTPERTVTVPKAEKVSEPVSGVVTTPPTDTAPAYKKEEETPPNTAQPEPQKVEPTPEPVRETAPVAEASKQPVEEHKPAAAAKPAMPERSVVNDPSNNGNAEKAARMETPAVKAKQPQVAAETDDKNQKKLVGEKYMAGQNSIHERLAQMKDDKSIGARMQFKPIENIKDAIGLNEKFLFINELFAGDINAYNQSVSELNSCPSIHEAFELLNKLTSEFQWDGQRSAETIEKLANLVQRRFM